jgi:hypothetical protein
LTPLRAGASASEPPCSIAGVARVAFPAQLRPGDCVWMRFVTAIRLCAGMAFCPARVFYFSFCHGLFVIPLPRMECVGSPCGALVAVRTTQRLDAADCPCCDTSCCCAKIRVSRHTSAVLAVGLIRVGRVVSVRRIIGRAISYSASSFTSTRWRTRGHSGRQN